MIINRWKEAWAVLFCCAVVLFALLSSWGKPALSSHSFRQTQTAQTIEIFLEEGWQPAETKFRYNGKPGITVLEMPLYQSLVMVLVKVSGMSIEQSGRLLSTFFGLLYAVFILLIAQKLRWERLGGRERWLALAFVFSTPLLAGTSQWVTIETMNCALAAAAFYALLHIESFLAFFFICVLASLSIKPTVLFAFAPIFLWQLWKNKRQAWKPILLGFFAVAFAALWFRHGEQANLMDKSSIGGIGNTAKFYFSLEALFIAKSWITLAQRIFVCILGCGVLLFFLIGINKPLRYGLGKKIQNAKPWLLASFMGAVLYLTVFINLNTRHNYYQLPLVFLFFLSFLIIVPREIFRGFFAAVFVFVVCGNLTIAELRLAKQDQDWIQALSFLKEKVMHDSGAELGIVYDEVASLPILGFYTGRYLRPLLYQDGIEIPRVPSEWWAICDGASGSDCREMKSKCIEQPKVFGRLWVCPLR